MREHVLSTPYTHAITKTLDSVERHHIIFKMVRVLEETQHFLLAKENTFSGRERTRSIETTNSMLMRCMGTDAKHSDSQIFSRHDNSIDDREHVLWTRENTFD